MKIVNLNDLAADAALDADLIIIGAGPAGLSIAKELGGTDIRVLVCESGVLGEHGKYYHLNQIELTPDRFVDPRDPLRMAFFSNGNPVWSPDVEPYGSRVRGYGGSTAFWGGKAATFDDNDFKKRDWVPFSGWPIRRSDVEPYFDRAGDILNLGPNIYDDRLWPAMGKQKPEPHFDAAKLRSTFWQYSRSRIKKIDLVRFDRDYLEIPGDNITVVLNATVTRIDLMDDLETFKGVEIATIENKRRFVRGKACVAAASAIENPRILRANNHQIPSGLGNQNDVVGRFLMDHPGSKVGSFKRENVKKVIRSFGFFGVQHNHMTHMYMHGLLLSPEKQAEERLLNVALFTLEGVAPDDPFKAAMRLAKFKSKNVLGDIASVAGSAGLLLKGFSMKLFQSSAVAEGIKEFVISLAMRLDSNMVVREFQSIGMPHKLASLDVYCLTEQHPNPDSRITLGETVDQFGVPRARVQWRLSEMEARSIMRITQMTADELERLGMPRPTLDDWIANSKPEDAKLADMAHPSGTTRMGDDPKTSVIDANCKVHGLNGLYVAGSSVFPTSGQANPTLMIISIALRLADHLKTRFATETSPAVARHAAAEPSPAL